MRKEYKKIENLDFDNMSDDEIDEYYRIRKLNSSKSLVPLYVYLLLSKTPNVHLTQAQILEKLYDCFGVSIERKSLNRILHTLDNSDLGIISTSDCGTWYDDAA